MARVHAKLQAFLPGMVETSFPTVRRTVCATAEARKFLQSLGLTEPDVVDDVLRNVLPKYGGDKVDVSDGDYESDIRRILTAFATNSEGATREAIGGSTQDCFYHGSRYGRRLETGFHAEPSLPRNR